MKRSYCRGGANSSASVRGLRQRPTASRRRCAGAVLSLAVVAAPLCGQAQPVAQDGKPAEVSEVTVEGRKGDCLTPVDSRRPNAIGKWHDAPSDGKTKRTEESAGTRALIPMIVDAHEETDFDFTHIHPGLAKLVREQLPRSRRVFACLGVLKGIKFLHVSQAGWDDFEVDFSDGALEWAVKPFNARQMTEGIHYLYFFPQPATKPFEDWLKSTDQGRPQYAGFAPNLASKLQAQWPALQTALKAWGPLKGYRFVRQHDDGAYVYLAAYEHRRVVWTISPPNADGKLTAMTYDETAG